MHTISSIVMKLSSAFLTVIALCLQSSQPQHSARGDEGSNGNLMDILLLYSSQEEATKWFHVSSEEARLAARFACSDIAAEDSFLVSVEITVTFTDMFY